MPEKGPPINGGFAPPLKTTFACYKLTQKTLPPPGDRLAPGWAGVAGWVVVGWVGWAGWVGMGKKSEMAPEGDLASEKVPQKGSRGSKSAKKWLGS